MSSVAQHTTRAGPISVRLTATDRLQLELAARLEGMKISTFLRHAGVEKAKARLLKQEEEHES